MRVGLVVPHIFMHHQILPNVIFSPAHLAISLSEGLSDLGVNVTLFTPGRVDVKVPNITADLTYFEKELKIRNDSYLELLKKHPFTFITLARQVQAEVISKAYAMANHGELDLVHVYTNEEDIALSFAKLCTQPTMFTHHDPFNFLVNYKNIFPKYADLNWLSLSMSQRNGMPEKTNWLANIYHGLDEQKWLPNYEPKGQYIAYIGRVIEPKGVHLAIKAVLYYNSLNPAKKFSLRIAGKHYSGHKKDSYWKSSVEPFIDGNTIIYEGFLSDLESKKKFIANAQALLVPSLFNEPFGMVSIEALALATPVIGLDSGAIPEIVSDKETGFVVKKAKNESATVARLAEAIAKIPQIKRHTCRREFEKRFTLERMCKEHFSVYQKLLKDH